MKALGRKLECDWCAGVYVIVERELKVCRLLTLLKLLLLHKAISF